MTAMRQLFPIADDIRALDALLDECDGELLSPEAEAAFVALAESLAQEEGAKLDNCVNYQRRLEMEAAKAREEAELYLAQARSRENRIRRMREFVRDYILSTNRRKVTTASGRVLSVQDNGGEAPVSLADPLDPATLPDRFVVVRRSPDIAAIRAALLAGEELPFAKLGERGNHLRVR